MKMRETSRDTDKKPCVNNYLTWANQVRLLIMGFQQLGAVVGGALINAFKPFVQALNSVMDDVIKFAETVTNALGVIFGWKLEVSGGSGLDDSLGGVTEDLGEAADDAGDLSGGLGDAAGSAGKLKKALSVLPFDELNQLSENLSSGGSGGSGGGGAGGTGAGDTGEGIDIELVPTDTIFENYKSEIDTLYELGEYIGETLTNMLNSIDWESVYEGARGFGTGLAEFLNGLISPELFSAVGKTIANALNTALWALNSFGKEFDWTDFGNSIAAGINSFFQNYDFNLLTNTFVVWTNGITNSIIAVLKETDFGVIGKEISGVISRAVTQVKWSDISYAFSLIGVKIADFLNNLITPGMFGNLGQALGNGLNAVISGAYNFIENIHWDEYGDALAEGINNFFDTFSWSGAGFTFGGGVMGILDAIRRAIIKTDWKQVGSDIGRMIRDIPWLDILSNVGKIIWEAINAGISAFKGLFGIEDIETAINGVPDELNLDALADGIKELGEALAPFVKGFAEGFIEVVDFLANTITPAIVNALGTAFQVLADALNALPPEVVSQLGEALGELAAALVIIKASQSAITGISTLVKTLTGGAAAASTTASTIAAAGGAAAKTTSAFGGLKSVVTNLGFGSLISGLVLTTKHGAELTDELKGGNGEITEFGGAIDSLINALKDSGSITNDMGDDLFALKEELESTGLSTDEFAQKFVEGLKEANLSSQEVEEAVGILSGRVNTSGDQIELFRKIIDSLGDSSTEMAKKVDLSGVSMTDAYEGMRTAVQNLRTDFNLSDTELNNLMQRLSDLEYQKIDPSEAWSQILVLLDEMKIDANTAADYIGEALPEAIDASGDAAANAAGSVGEYADTVTSTRTEAQYAANKTEIMTGTIQKSGDAADTAAGKVSNYSDEIGAVPEGKTTTINADTEVAEQNIDRATEKMNSASGEKKATLSVDTSGASTALTLFNTAIALVLKSLLANMELKIKTEDAKIALDSVESQMNRLDKKTTIEILGNDSKFTSVLNGVTEMIKNMQKEVTVNILGNLEKLRQTITDVERRLRNMVSSKTIKFLGDINDATDKIRKLTQKINGVDDEKIITFKPDISAFSNIQNELRRIGKNAAQAFASGISSVHIPMPHISVTSSAYATDSGYSYSMNSSVNWYKAGGLFTKAAIAGIGEAGDEAVLPLENRRTMGMIADSIISASGGMGISSTELRQAVAEGVATAMMNNSQGIPEIIVNAELRTENDEVLARAVTRGQQRIDYRTNPTPKMGY